VQQVRQQAGEAEAEENERDRQLLGGVGRAPWWGRQRRAEDSDGDRPHRHVLIAASVLTQHSLCEEHQHEQAGGERRLDDHQRSKQQRDHLQREAEDR
jgi:hypothetical protein